MSNPPNLIDRRPLMHNGRKVDEVTIYLQSTLLSGIFGLLSQHDEEVLRCNDRARFVMHSEKAPFFVVDGNNAAWSVSCSINVDTRRLCDRVVWMTGPMRTAIGRVLLTMLRPMKIKIHNRSQVPRFCGVGWFRLLALGTCVLILRFWVWCRIVDRHPA